jgi:hypothetical protein
MTLTDFDEHYVIWNLLILTFIIDNINMDVNL